MPPLFLEYAEVLKRPEHRLAHGLREKEVDGFWAELAGIAVPVDIYFYWRPLVSDPGDEMVLETAINGRADAVITFNVHDLSPLRNLEFSFCGQVNF